MKDAILVEQTLAGDHQAFNSLITDYYADIYGMILSWIKDTEDAKDLTQEVFISAYQKLSSLRQPQHFHLWLRQIAKRRCQNWQRDRQANFTPLNDDLFSKEPSTDEVLILRETLAKVMEAIENLPESEKKLLKEHYLDDVSYSELEARHGVSAKALVVRLVRARRKIRDQLEKTLSAFVAFLHDHTESILTGGAEIVKLSIKTKLIVGGIAIILLLGGAGVLVNRHYVRNRSKQNISQISQENYSKSPAKPVSNGEKSSTKGVIKSVKKEITLEKIQAGESKAETLAMNEAKSNESAKNANSSNTSGVSAGESANESKELTPEMKQKVDVYTELASLLPEFKKVWPILTSVPNGDNNRTDEQLAIIKQFSGLLDKILRICDPFIGPPAIFRPGDPGYGQYGGINLLPMFTQVAKYLGKELPFDGNTDYFSAEDYKGGTGGF
jgi:RNA polymerase sigma-70 factor (ECF subfamily)